MNCTEIKLILSARLEGEATASQWHWAEEHMAACRHCAQIWQCFQSSTGLFKTQLPQLAPAEDLWHKISARLEQTQEPAQAIRFRAGFRDWMESFFPQTPRALDLVRFGFAVLLLALIGLPFIFNRAPKETVATNSAVERDTTLVAATLPHAPAPPKIEKTAAGTGLELQMANYLEQTRVVLLEVKNSGGEDEALDWHGIRQSSQRLLEQTVMLKADLKQEQAAVLQNLVEQLELMLFDLANVADDAQREEVEMLRAAIRQNDLLIKIEIVDLKALDRAAESRPPTKRRTLKKTII